MPPASTTRLLLTGATGFIGSRLAARLHQLGCDTHAIVRPNSQFLPLQQLLGEPHIHIHDGTTENMLAIVQRVQPTLIFHVASLFLAQHRTQDVSQLICSNVELAAQLAEAAALHKVPYFINTGTAWQHFNDADFNPVNLYAATKQAAAGILQYYADSGAFRVLNLELFDTYGPGDTRPKLFTLLRKAAQSGEPLAMSPGDQLIDLVYIDDVLDAYLAAMKHIQLPGAAPFQTFSVTSGKPLPLRDLVTLWQTLTQRPLSVQWGARPYRPREVMIPWTRGTPLPGWTPAVSLNDGITRMESHPYNIPAAGGTP